MLPSPKLAGALVKALAKEPARKRPRLACGEAEQWEAEHRQLVQWLREKAPKAALEAAPAPVKYSDERMESLEKYLDALQSVSA